MFKYIVQYLTCILTALIWALEPLALIVIIRPTATCCPPTIKAAQIIGPIRYIVENNDFDFHTLMFSTQLIVTTVPDMRVRRAGENWRQNGRTAQP